MIALPARGPRPTFKGEEVLTLRLMDDVVVPKVAEARPTPANGWHYFDEPAGQYQGRPQAYNSPEMMYAPVSMSAYAGMPTTPNPRTMPQPERITLIALKSNDIFGVTSYRIENGLFDYVQLGGVAGSVDAAEVDWTRTSELNTAHVTAPTFESRAY